MMEDNRTSAQAFLNLIKKSRRGKFKIYIGMSAGVGKTYRMLQEAHSLLKSGIDVKIGYIETHNRKETHALLEGLPIIPRRKLFYKGKELDELDVQAVINLRPEVVIVDELAHTNIEGSKNEKRWQDVMEILDAGINVISAVNIQHIESLNEDVKKITGIEVKERIPDSVVAQADEVVNIDLTAEELIDRLKDGKIYDQSKINSALSNFFKSDHILQLRGTGLEGSGFSGSEKSGSRSGTDKPCEERKNSLRASAPMKKLPKMSSGKRRDWPIITTAKWYLLYVQIPRESADKIALDKQRHLINNFKLATELGAEIIKVENTNVTRAIMEQCEERKITTVCIGKTASQPLESDSGNRYFQFFAEQIVPGEYRLSNFELKIEN